MMKPVDEAARLAALKRYQILDTAPEAPFERITALVQRVFGVPIVAISLVDEHRQWFKSQIGLAVDETARDISFCTHTIRQPEALIINDALCDPRFKNNPLVCGAPFIRSYAGIPLASIDGHNIGSLCVIDTVPRDYSAEQIAILAGFGQLVQNEIELRRTADCDALTGVLSRRALLQVMTNELENFGLTGAPCALAYVDIDLFKRINDVYGHALGDAALRQIVAACESIIGPTDALGRLGGDEFVILLRGQAPAQVSKTIDRIRAAIGAIDITGDDNTRITASFGIAMLDPDCASVPHWLAKADQALFAAKQSGRNCAQFAPRECQRRAA